MKIKTGIQAGRPTTHGPMPANHYFPDGTSIRYRMRDGRVVGALFNNKGAQVGRAFLFQGNAKSLISKEG